MNQKNAWNELYMKHERVWDGFADILWITEHLNKGAEILELGSGNGKTLIPLIKEGYVCTGVDFSEYAVGRIKERLASTGEGEHCRLIVSDVMNLTQDLGAFDAVVMNYLLNHLTLNRAFELFEEIPQFLRENGLVFAEAFGPGDMRNSLNGKERNGIVYNYHTLEDWRRLGSDGLQLLKLEVLRREKNYEGQRVIREIIRGIWRIKSGH